MKTVWIVSEGSPGHVSQSVGLADALASIIPVQTVLVQGRSKIRGWMRPFVRWIMGPMGTPLSEALLRRIAEVKIPADSPRPDLIVSSGGKSVFAAKTLAGRSGVPYVFIGERKPYPASWFHTIISPVFGESCANSIDVELIPTPVTPEFIAQKGAEEKNVWCMIVGGASRSHRFCDKDWIGMAQGMNALAERENIRWLVTTSRRTGAQAEVMLKEHLNEEFIEDAIWWAEAPRKELYSFMARSEVLFVTQDSVTMVTEAVSSGKPVVVVGPERVDFPKGSFLPAYFERLQIRRRIQRVVTKNIAELRIDYDEFDLLSDDPLELLARGVLERLL